MKASECACKFHWRSSETECIFNGKNSWLKDEPKLHGNIIMCDRWAKKFNRITFFLGGRGWSESKSHRPQSIERCSFCCCFCWICDSLCHRAHSNIIIINIIVIIRFVWKKEKQGKKKRKSVDFVRVRLFQILLYVYMIRYVTWDPDDCIKTL